MADRNPDRAEGRDYGRELYPFLYDDGGEAGRDKGAPASGGGEDPLLEEVKRSTRDKARTILDIRGRLLADQGAEIARCAEEMAARFAGGGTLFAFGNGGSATDASDAAADCLAPARPEWRTLPALSLNDDGAIVTAIANDVGFDNVFRRQIIAYARAGDIALGFSTSGSSGNVLSGLERAHEQGLLTVAFAGYDGGRMRDADCIDHCFVARSDHIPRIQEGHATAWHALLAAVQRGLASADPTVDHAADIGPPGDPRTRPSDEDLA